VDGEVLGYGDAAEGDLLTQVAAVCGAGRLDVFEGDGRPGVLGADRPAQEPVAMEHPDLGDIARVVADGHLAPDVGGECGVEVAQALEADAVAVHGAGLGDHDQQQVEGCQALRTPRQPAVGLPRLLRRDAGLAVWPGVLAGVSGLFRS